MSTFAHWGSSRRPSTSEADRLRDVATFGSEDTWAVAATSSRALPSKRCSRNPFQLCDGDPMKHQASLVVSLGLAVVSGSACALDAHGVGAEGTFSRTLAVSGPVDLDVQTGSGDIQIRTGAPGTVEVRGRVRCWNIWRTAHRHLDRVRGDPDSIALGTAGWVRETPGCDPVPPRAHARRRDRVAVPSRHNQSRTPAHRS